MLFVFVQILYWLSLSTWFGAVFFLLIAPPIILRTVNESKPILPDVLSVNLNGQHSTLLAGTIISNLLTPVMRIQIGCAAAMSVAIIGQWCLVETSGGAMLPPILRSAMFIAAAVLVVYDWRWVWPQTFKSRQEYLDNVDDPDKANPALDRFDKSQAESLTVIRNVFFLLLGIILFSGDIRTTVQHLA